MSESSNAKEDQKNIRIFQLNDEKAKFEELEIETDVNLAEILNSESIFYIVDPGHYQSFIWTGKSASVRMKFIAAKKAGEVRDKIGPAIKINTVDEGEETSKFQIMIGEEEEPDYEEEQTGPAYEGKIEDNALLKELTLEKIVLLLEKIGCPEGYTREMVIEGKNVYGYQEIYKEYLGEIIKERKLYPLDEDVPDGSYLAAGLTPRLILSYNKVVILDLLRKMTEEEMTNQQEIQEKITKFKQSKQPFIQSNDEETESKPNDS